MTHGIDPRTGQPVFNPSQAGKDHRPSQEIPTQAPQNRAPQSPDGSRLFAPSAPNPQANQPQNVRYAPQSAPQSAQPEQPRSDRYAQYSQPVGAFSSAQQAPQYAQPVAAEMQGRPRLGVTQWAGATLSLALIVGLTVWGYRLMVRDVSGVPVIAALEGAARLVPDDPGGQLAMHQGLAVNAVTADGSASAPAERLALAPRDVTLTDEDQPTGALTPILSSYAPSDNAYLTPQNNDLNVIAVEISDLELSRVETVSAPNSDVEIANLIAQNSTEAETVRTSPIPKLRPVRVASLAPITLPIGDDSADQTTRSPSLDGVAGDILAAVTSGGEVQSSSVIEGARLVQLGAYQNMEIARQEWDRLNSKFSEIMTGKARLIERADSNGKTFYRLRVHGFTDAADAARFCAVLTSMNAACVPTAHR